MEVEFSYGLNVLDDMIKRGLQDLSCDRIDCMAYNISLDYVLKLISKYGNVSKVRLYGNSQKFSISKENKTEILRLMKEKKVEVYHFSEGFQVVHAKMYRFWKGGKIVFGAIGSPNLSSNSNQNIETLVYVTDPVIIEQMWNSVSDLYSEFGIVEDPNPPESLVEISGPECIVDADLLEDLWKHQQEILRWMAQRSNSIVNIPPGTGKTKLALAYIDHIIRTRPGTTMLILVPTKTLIDQWMRVLEKNGIKAFEWDTRVESLREYLANPSKKAAVTIFSRFYEQYHDFINRVKIVRSDVVIVADECHNLYEHMAEFNDFNSRLTAINRQVWNVGLSATLDSFNVDNVRRYVSIMGGESNRYNISLPTFYSVWNNKNKTPILKPINYVPIRYRLSSDEMREYSRRSRYVGMEAHMDNPVGDQDYQAAIRRAQWLRGLEGGERALKDYLNSHIAAFNKNSIIIFVQTNEIAERIHQYLTKHPGWNPDSFAYIYDSSRNDQYRDYAMDRFKKNEGFCLISERMLSEGFDLPKVSSIILHGSHRSQRDWIQKIGRAIRYDPESPKAIADIIDIVFCSSNGDPLPIEEERFQTLTSIST